MPFNEMMEKAMADIRNIASTADPAEVAAALADVIVEQAELEAESQDLTSVLASIKSVNPGDEFKIKTTKGISIYMHTPGTPAQLSKVTNEFVSLTANRASFYITLDVNDLTAGRYGDYVEDMNNVKNHFLSARNKIIFDTYAAGASTSSTASSTDFQTKLDAAMATIMDKPGTGLVIMGRAKNIIPINKFTGFSPTTQDKFFKNGILGSYNGATIISLQDYTDDEGNSYISDDHLVIARYEAGKGVKHRSLSKMVVPYAALPGYQIHVYEEMGFALVHSDRVHKLVIS